MRRVNKYILLFTGTILLLSSSLMFIGQKLPKLLSHATYYCQSTLLSFLTPIPPQLVLLPFVIIAFIALIAIAQLVHTVIKVQSIKKSLIKNAGENKKLTKLLGELQLKDKTYLINDNNPFAFCLGVINPNIYISTALLQLVSREELKVVLHHEEYHLNNRDTLTMMVGSFGKSLFPFFPILSDFIKHYRIEREVRADREAVERSGNKNVLASALRKLLSSTSPVPAFAPAIIEYDTIEPRIAAITNHSTSRFKGYKILNIIISFAFIVIVGFTLFGPVHMMHMNAQDHHIIMLHAYEDTCLNWAHDLKVHP